MSYPAVNAEPRCQLVYLARRTRVNLDAPRTDHHPRLPVGCVSGHAHCEGLPEQRGSHRGAVPRYAHPEHQRNPDIRHKVHPGNLFIFTFLFCVPPPPPHPPPPPMSLPLPYRCTRVRALSLTPCSCVPTGTYALPECRSAIDTIHTLQSASVHLEVSPVDWAMWSSPLPSQAASNSTATTATTTTTTTHERATSATGHVGSISVRSASCHSLSSLLDDYVLCDDAVSVSSYVVCGTDDKPQHRAASVSSFAPTPVPDPDPV